MRIDHVAFGWNSLEPVRMALESVGLDYDYGGMHADGTTHMALTGFEDGSYLEYIAPTPETDPNDAGFWPEALGARAGPAAWAVRVDDIVAEAKRAVDAGVAIEGPLHGGRDRPDGRRVEWDQIFECVDADGRWQYPFPITDRTPREWRVSPTDGVGSVSGIETVVVGVDDVDEATAQFERRYRIPTPVDIDTDAVDGAVSVVPGFPLAFVSASESRLERVGERPVVVLLGTDDLASARRAYELTPTAAWGSRRLAWFDHDIFRGRVGIVE